MLRRRGGRGSVVKVAFALAALALAAGTAYAEDVEGCNGAWGEWGDCVLDPNLGVFKRYRFFKVYAPPPPPGRRALLARQWHRQL
eukprot:CAMPEP_0198472336 /NCGR_PEP_ID=MMETSP1456-20131121/29335_1 /TAXON_ID=1461544 ORGANISM="Unidentified sp., Strain RCC1871" /NCGR_SAMPLE_ID=MMETSP1456 /ASSEMBLY_ACC=CAM_ASM_001119 /LENGTH=84 /DNA_ID=CAMNT_0044198959 /DNA_START=339 /DNA_END=590 /DNA_ORIENTATION=-